jgi:hypothetical protein
VLQVSSIPGMEMPTGLTVEKISELVGPDVIMPVLDVGPQEELAMSLEAWVEVREKRRFLRSHMRHSSETRDSLPRQAPDKREREKTLTIKIMLAF